MIVVRVAHPPPRAENEKPLGEGLSSGGRRRCAGRPMHSLT